MQGEGAVLDRVAIVGGTGQLGAYLVREFGPAAISLGHHEVEVEEPATIAAALEQHRPTFVISTAAFHQVDACEREPGRAFGVNAAGTQNLASACASREIGFAYISTDYVFDGTLGRPYKEGDASNPLQVYGISKFAGELAAQLHPGGYVLRTSGVYGKGGARGKGATFVDRIVAQARRGEPIRVVEDVTFSPTYAASGARFMHDILLEAPPGVYHATDEGSCTWYEFARAALRFAGLTNEIEPVTQASLGPGTARPADSSLEHQAAHLAGVAGTIPWIEGLEAYMRESGLAR